MFERDVVDRTMARLANSSSYPPGTSAAWLSGLTPADALRYARASKSGESMTEEAVAEVAWARLLRTAAWRVEQRVDGIVDAERHLYSIEAFFARHAAAPTGDGATTPTVGEPKAGSADRDGSLGGTAPRAETEWLGGRDGRGRSVLAFYSARHTPGAIETSECARRRRDRRRVTAP